MQLQVGPTRTRATRRGSLLLFIAAVILSIPNLGCVGLTAAGNPSNTAVEVSIDTPASGATVSGTVTVTTTVSSNTTSVQFKVDGTNSGAAVTAAPFSHSLNTTALANGSHSLTAVASDASGQTTSAAVPITVNNATAPTISISSPSVGGDGVRDGDGDHDGVVEHDERAIQGGWDEFRGGGDGRAVQPLAEHHRAGQRESLVDGRGERCFRTDHQRGSAHHGEQCDSADHIHQFASVGGDGVRDGDGDDDGVVEHDAACNSRWMGRIPGRRSRPRRSATR